REKERVFTATMPIIKDGYYACLNRTPKKFRCLLYGEQILEIDLQTRDDSGKEKVGKNKSQATINKKQAEINEINKNTINTIIEEVEKLKGE
ncbi:hypothetical protein KAH94_05355, partial [bacterium]|nr:hypothetical protein [bacterium]